MRLQSFDEFWPYYLSQHTSAACRGLHYVGTTIALTSIVLGGVMSPWFFAAAPFSGYFFAWIGHFVIEKNRPATFTYPLWSLAADFKMYFLALTGSLGNELQRAASR